MTQNAIYWLRQDLRLSDNIALTQAIDECDNVYAIYILDEELGGKWCIKSASKWWLHYSLKALSKDIPVSLLKGESLAQLINAISETKVSKVYANIVFEPAYLELDARVKNELDAKGIEFLTFNSNLIFPSDEIKTQAGTVYNVFSPFFKNCLARLSNRNILPKPKALDKLKSFGKMHIDELKLLPSIRWDDKFEPRWTPGEISAEQKLQYFLKHILKTYRKTRGFPAKLGTSRLSPHLHFGEISHLQVWDAIQKSPIKNESSFAFQKEIAWIEFAYYLLYHYPSMPDENFKKAYDDFKWHKDDVNLKKWQKGNTGYPIVDAGMRELWGTGYMHNRVRMIVASFLTKHLLIDWREGEKWFWDTLIDADLAANSMNWQWVAGTGADAAQYNRIFNPVLQGKKFDPNGDYVRAWVPELKRVPNQYIHEPWNMPKVLLAAIDVEIPGSYPERIVDHAFARKFAIEHYRDVIAKAKLKKQS